MQADSHWPCECGLIGTEHIPFADQKSLLRPSCFLRVFGKSGSALSPSVMTELLTLSIRGTPTLQGTPFQLPVSVNPALIFQPISCSWVPLLMDKTPRCLTSFTWGKDSTPLFTQVPKTCSLRLYDTQTKFIINLHPRAIWHQVHLWPPLYSNMVFGKDSPWLAVPQQNTTLVQIRGVVPPNHSSYYLWWRHVYNRCQCLYDGKVWNWRKFSSQGK